MTRHEDGYGRSSLDLLQSGDIDEVMQGIDKMVEAAPSYEKLFSRWQRQQWNTEDFDYSVDAQQWQETPEDEKKYTRWTFSSFFLGEERVTTELLPFAIAAPSDEARMYLATQIADEAKHVVFFDRFYREVFGVTVAGLRASLEAEHERMNDHWVEMFDGILVDVANRLRLDPTDRPALYEGVTLYMIVIEGMMALTGTRFLLRNLKDMDRFPGFQAGFTCVARDESRHVGFGVKLLSDAIKEDPQAREVVAATLKRVLPVASLALVPPWAEDPYDYTDPISGTHSSEVFDYAAKSLQKKLAAIGIRPEDMQAGASPVQPAAA